MKRKCIVTLCVALCLVLCACGAQKNPSAGENVGQVLDEQTVQTQPEVDSTPTETQEQSHTPVTGEAFFNPENNILEEGKVTIRPRHVYWEGDVLVAECFVINGLDKPIFNIHVKDLDFSNANGLIADAAFGVLNGVTLEAHHHTLWTFRFPAELVSQPNANLQSLDCHSNVAFNY